jgi:hypothetical protein
MLRAKNDVPPDVYSRICIMYDNWAYYVKFPHDFRSIAKILNFDISGLREVDESEGAIKWDVDDMALVSSKKEKKDLFECWAPSLRVDDLEGFKMA